MVQDPSDSQNQSSHRVGRRTRVQGQGQGQEQEQELEALVQVLKSEQSCDDHGNDDKCND